MKGVALNVLVATLIFFGLTMLARNDGVIPTVFVSLIFAMTYAAFQVAVVVFRNDDK